ncbi:MAG: transcription regulator [Thermoplasmatales archaeon I-plasma]|nr:MAG: transcription regulator [Thermoplasmatales archaeon I-plasma]
MRRNITDIEQRLIVLLKRNSRITITEISKELGVSRITAKKALDTLTRSGRIKRFTVTLEDENREMVLVRTDDASRIPSEYVIERFKLIDGSFISVLFYEDLLSIKDAHINGVDIAVSREQNENVFRMEGLHCDYCGNEIKGKPIMVEIGGKTYYACCPNCERDLKKRRELMPNMD